MATSKSSEEVKQEYLLAMGEELGGLFYALWNEVSWLHMKWAEYVELFGSKPSRIALMNQSASHFFYVVQTCMFEDTLLHIARLTDGPKSAGYENLTIQRLPGLISEQGLARKVAELVDDAVLLSAFCRDWRNRHLAHRDLQLSLGEKVQPLKPASRAEVKLSVDGLGKVLNAVELHYMNSEILFPGILSPDGAVALLYVLHDGLKSEQEKRVRRRSGEYRPDDDSLPDL